jgi:cyclic pyranopterin phosphate synthase
MLYRLDEDDGALLLLPMAARRALDWAGRRLSLAGWQSLPLAARNSLVAAGAAPSVDTEKVVGLLAPASPPAEACASAREPGPESVPDAIARAYGAERPVAPNVWSALSPLDRFVLAKVAERARPGRLAEAYQEIVGASRDSSHLSPEGGVRMVDVGGKATTHRRATAQSRVQMNAEAYAHLLANNPKGDVLNTARIAAILAAKKTSEWIPLCHPLPLTKVEVKLVPRDAEREVGIAATVETRAPTGVEMEALTAASAAALTVYDMLKAFDKGLSIGPTVLLEKSGGKSGDYRRS